MYMDNGRAVRTDFDIPSFRRVSGLFGLRVITASGFCAQQGIR